MDLRDITYFPRAQTVSATLDGAPGSVHYYRFGVGLSMVVDLRLRSQDADGDLVLEDADGVVVAEARSPGTANESVAKRLEPGLLLHAGRGAGDEVQLLCAAL